MEVDRQSGLDTQVGSPAENRVKSPIRMAYEAEVQFLKNQNGDLETIRQRLGLSRRKIAQLLLVDPSAWTRWTGSGSDAPPVVYRALDWYLAGMEKDPEYRRLAKRFGEWLSHKRDHEGRLAALENQLETRGNDQSRRGILALLTAFVSGVLLTYLALRTV